MSQRNTIATAMGIVGDLEMQFDDYAFAIGGTVAYRGVSNNDMDIFAIPFTDKARPEEHISWFLENNGWTLTTIHRAESSIFPGREFTDGVNTIHLIVVTVSLPK